MTFSKNCDKPSTERKHLPKTELIDGRSYMGHCRNASVAIWRAEKQRFEYQRNKFGYIFTEEIEAPEDFKGYDVFYARELLA